MYSAKSTLDEIVQSGLPAVRPWIKIDDNGRRDER